MSSPHAAPVLALLLACAAEPAGEVPAREPVTIVEPPPAVVAASASAREVEPTPEVSPTATAIAETAPRPPADDVRPGKSASGDDSGAPRHGRPGEAPRGNVDIASASVSGGTVADAGLVIARMRPGFRRCYKLGLNDDPSIAGSLTIDASIGPNGEVASARASRVNGLPSNVAACVAAVVSSRTFAPPEGGSATISIPVRFAL